MILRLGHCELFVTDMERAREFYIDILGFREHDSDKDHIYLRGVDEFDLHTLTLTKNKTGGLGHFALRVSDPEDLDRLADHHKRLGVPTLMVPEGTEPGQGRALRIVEPNGHPIEFYHEMQQVNVYNPQGGLNHLPMRATHRDKGIPPLRIDHMNIRVASVDQALKYWRDELSFSVSEYVEKDNGTFAAWTRRCQGTHDVALVQSASGAGLHHVAYTVQGPAEIIRTADLLADAGYQDAIEFGPGRHGLSNAFFLYIRDFDGNRTEIYTGDYSRDIDLPPVKWTWEEYDKRGRLWWGPAYPEKFLEVSPVNNQWI
ncbi:MULTISPECIES: 3,4-dihydroxyphenylacetate 2,3-dioxygenase [unclassified Paenibacillus]|uniref:3,4-dihydroxyphenylacetate 2,3-dioxygenase n=1 Tax=unclassified Paenibacillus TaxID=185978 RepID=UPI001AE92902|nr:MULTISPECIES: 3,4-dihydroxyphenylacetate 2,3-dioxygenase [unclassified Paenibacillus]MBP1157155.1 catechol 2,3-dioxygenase [Paenibacillus sp. PvP091]MBP1172106.1 catechol 2,3-dioxygenase [Paenibacillus sp. PvR098]MBP2438487.1 catechol 2,3-dioxygenase [Paenibacillus sp. PvP052]